MQGVPVAAAAPAAYPAGPARPQAAAVGVPPPLPVAQQVPPSPMSVSGQQTPVAGEPLPPARPPHEDMETTAHLL